MLPALEHHSLLFPGHSNLPVIKTEGIICDISELNLETTYSGKQGNLWTYKVMSNTNPPPPAAAAYTTRGQRCGSEAEDTSNQVVMIHSQVINSPVTTTRVPHPHNQVVAVVMMCTHHTPHTTTDH